MSENEQKILELLRAYNEDIPADITVNLLHGGYIDSFDIVNIVADLEENFHIEIDPEDIVPENFDSVVHMGGLLKKYSR
ncbi:MAG: acyl carrier protein [Selenomonas ruminantium]|uniref:Acyl carrier protein n=1 Tax=Selenomonas ruminantium TaxID=971 RepID=A0A927ZUU8_SELRU|nr:acyl carrier protein [Selenomonas ruminantium]MBE6084915.1 acyl carrier protein [Selenomonas ruminantium]